MMFGVQAPPMKDMQSDSGHIGCGVRFLRRFSVIAASGLVTARILQSGRYRKLPRYQR